MQNSLWIATGINVEFDLVFHIASGPPATCPRWNRYGLTQLPLAAPDWTVSEKDLDETRRLLSAIQALEGTAVWAAFRMASFALNHRQGDIAIVLFWSALESLFGPNDDREMIFQISQRIGLFLAPNRAAARELAARVKKSYSLRSGVVHGTARGLAPRGNAEKAAAVNELFKDTMFWLRTSLKKIMLDSELRSVFSHKIKRSDFLSGLAYSTP